MKNFPILKGMRNDVKGISERLREKRRDFVRTYVADKILISYVKKLKKPSTAFLTQALPYPSEAKLKVYQKEEGLALQGTRLKGRIEKRLKHWMGTRNALHFKTGDWELIAQRSKDPSCSNLEVRTTATMGRGVFVKEFFITKVSVFVIITAFIVPKNKGEIYWGRRQRGMLYFLFSKF